MLILGIFPLGPHAFLEEMIIRLERELGRWGDIVL